MLATLALSSKIFAYSLIPRILFLCVFIVFYISEIDCYF